MKIACLDFDISTIKGLKQAEQYKARLENKYDKVIVSTVGLNRVRISVGKSKENNNA